MGESATPRRFYACGNQFAFVGEMCYPHANFRRTGFTKNGQLAIRKGISHTNFRRGVCPHGALGKFAIPHALLMKSRISGNLLYPRLLKSRKIITSPRFLGTGKYPIQILAFLESSLYLFLPFQLPLSTCLIFESPFKVFGIQN